MKTTCIILFVIVSFLLGYIQRASNLMKIKEGFDRITQALTFQEEIKKEVSFLKKELSFLNQEAETLKNGQTKLQEEIKVIAGKKWHR